MRILAADLTRHGSGDVLGGRLPSDPARRPAAASTLLDRAVTRWAVGAMRDALEATVERMLAEQTAVEPLDMRLHISARTITVEVGRALADLPIPQTAPTTHAAA
ncbi:hypothetical protein [Euzebya rosea]|uniref:hypothetical protein n=1 Tax=Euzebya rosea TaxID=2052804 RepID=UPI000D3ED8CA|nr:hypothetical protein [Euzebya rosea]